MTWRKAFSIIGLVLLAHAAGLIGNLYGIFEWYDIPMHWAGGFAMGALGLAIWYEGVEDIRYKKSFEKHLKWWLVPGIVLGFVALIGILWELHEYLLDAFMGPVIGTIATYRQPDLADTMMDFVLDLFGGAVAIILFHRNK